MMKGRTGTEYTSALLCDERKWQRPIFISHQLTSASRIQTRRIEREAKLQDDSKSAGNQLEQDQSAEKEELYVEEIGWARHQSMTNNEIGYVEDLAWPMSQLAATARGRPRGTPPRGRALCATLPALGKSLERGGKPRGKYRGSSEKGPRGLRGSRAELGSQEEKIHREPKTSADPAWIRRC